MQVNETPAFEEVFIYDVEGETLAAGDTFTVNNVTYTILQGGVTLDLSVMCRNITPQIAT